VNVWQSYLEERGCPWHFLRLLAVWWPGAQLTLYERFYLLTYFLT